MSTETEVQKPARLLTDEKRKRRDELEPKMRVAFNNFVDFSEWLFEFHQDKLYIETHDSFDDYCQDRWGLSRSWGRKLVQAGKVVLSMPDDTEKPTSVRAALALARGTSPSLENGEKETEPETTVQDEDPAITWGKANGIIPKDAVVNIERPEPVPAPDVTPESPAPTTEDWLATLPARSKLSERCRRLFDLEAVACQKVDDARKKYRDNCRVVTEPLQKEGKCVGPWLAKHCLHFKINGPSKWQACADCGGTGFRSLGGETGQCGTCKTMGYHV